MLAISAIQTSISSSTTAVVPTFACKYARMGKAYIATANIGYSDIVTSKDLII